MFFGDVAMNGFDYEAVRAKHADEYDRYEYERRKTNRLVVWVTMALAMAFGLLTWAVWG